MKDIFFLIIFLFSLTTFTSVDIPSVQFDGSSLKYSMAINLTHYLYLLSENNSEVENKTIYQSLDDLEGKKAGLVVGSIQMLIAYNKGTIRNYKIFNSYDEAGIAVSNHSIEHFPVIKEIAGEAIQMDSEDLTYIEVTEEEQEEIDSVLIVNSNYPELSAQLNEYVPIFDNITKIWIGKDDGLKYFNKTIENPQKNLTVLVHFNQVPFSFIRDGELVGILPHVMYGFANKYNYSLEIVEAQNNDNIYKILKIIK